jgi:hypothetical protein
VLVEVEGVEAPRKRLDLEANGDIRSDRIGLVGVTRRQHKRLTNRRILLGDGAGNRRGSSQDQHCHIKRPFSPRSARGTRRKT